MQGKLMMNKNVIFITGPTASGKTDFALKLAENADIEIISADSRQIYKYMNIGTAKPSSEELNKVKHHLIDYLNPDEDFSAGKFAEVADKLIHEIKEKGKIPVIVGGTGFYIKALFEGLSADDESDSDIRSDIRIELSNLLEIEGKDYLYDLLKESDLVAAEKYSDKNPRRVIRALEYIRSTGKKFSDTFGTENPSGFIPRYFVINPPRQDLYIRINKRTEKMFASGLIRELAELIEMGYSPSLNALNTVGYKECASMIFGEINLERAIELTKQNTRRYAKRQVTWLNQLPKYDTISILNDYTLEKIFLSYNLK
jgi:tRNA dimethylallyltransferase